MLKISWERSKRKQKRLQRKQEQKQEREHGPSQVFGMLQTNGPQVWNEGEPEPPKRIKVVTDRHGRILRWDYFLLRYVHEVEIPVNERGLHPWTRSDTHRIVASYETWEQMIHDCGPLTAA